MCLKTRRSYQEGTYRKHSTYIYLYKLFLFQAIELAPEEKAAYVARSRCYLLLGEPRKALGDAEEALKLDPKHAKALLQKAEALYYCGEFELSLVHYHRGLRARPDLNEFRLGVQKAQVK